MIVEVRRYQVKPGRREEFIRFFETGAMPALREAGMPVFGPLLDLEQPDVFHWLRAFPSLEERERLKGNFYEGSLWKNELEAIAMPMLESYSAALTVVSEGFESFTGARSLLG